MPGFEFDVDPNLDPELALALRVSMEEERARQEAAAKKAAEDASKQEKGAEQPSSSQDAIMGEQGGPVTSEAANKKSELTVSMTHPALMVSGLWISCLSLFMVWESFYRGLAKVIGYLIFL